jgi:hypothetical protein
MLSSAMFRSGRSPIRLGAQNPVAPCWKHETNSETLLEEHTTMRVIFFATNVEGQKGSLS